MRLETIHFFGEVLRGDMSIFQFLDSDFTCVNDRLAAHYGIAGVTDPTFRKVKLDESLHRGGVLTHASILTGLSDGKDGHPIKRGIWLLRNLLDDPPPPPPPNVPELDRERTGAEEPDDPAGARRPSRSGVLHGLPSQDRSLGHRVRGIRRRRQLAA